MTHDELTNLAVTWLQRPHSGKAPGCDVALSEIGLAWHGEKADAWGYRRQEKGGAWGSTLVEVKVSRGDFLADRKKPHRQNGELGVGRFRYYLCPKGLIQPEELPDRWGLIWATPSGRLYVQCGHVLEGNAAGPETIDKWGHVFDDSVEKDMLARMLGRLGSPDEFNRTYRELMSDNNRLRQSLSEKQTTEWEMKKELRSLQRQVDWLEKTTGQTALPRKRRRSE